MELKQHLFLTGFMGSGKTTAGKKLASALRVPFIDLDDYIEKKERRSIAEIFEQDGEKKFREIETGYLTEVIHLPEPHVVSLGGGTICFHNNLERVKQQGKLIYLELSPAALADRIRHSNNPRPLLKDLEPDELIKTIETLLKVRQRYYGQADIIINGLNLTTQHVLQKLFAEA
jgi:shikimate kinase